MGQSDFFQKYNELRALPLDIKTLSIPKKEIIASNLISALEALKIAEETICKQSDTILKTNNELLNALNGNKKPGDIVHNNPPNPAVSSNSPTSYSSVVKQTPLVLTSNNSSIDFENKDVKEKLTSTLQNISVSSSRITKNGSFIVNFPDQDSKKKASDELKNAFQTEIKVESLTKSLPQLTVFSWPSDTKHECIQAEICKKDETIQNMIENGSKIELVKYWGNKNKLAVRVTPDIRDHIMLHNKGYLYIGLSRCKVYDRFFIPQCYHCFKYYHYANDCPDKTKKPICGRCSKSHEDRRNCNSAQERCINCLSARNSAPKNHCAFSYSCPVYTREKEKLIMNTNYGEKK